MLAFWAFTLGALSVTAGIALFMQEPLSQPMSGVFLVFSISWITVLGQLLFKMRTMGTFVAPVCTILLLFHLFLVPGHGVSSPPPSNFANFHILMSILGEAFAICACAISMVFLIQRRALKRKQFAWLTGAITPLDKLDKALVISLWAGFLFITLGLISGAIYSQFYMPAPKSGLTGKIVWALLVWIWYLATLLARNIFNLSERRIAQMSMVGFLLLSVSFFGLIQWGGEP